MTSGVMHASDPLVKSSTAMVVVPYSRPVPANPKKKPWMGARLWVKIKSALGRTYRLLTSEHPDDPLPREWIRVALLLSAVAVWLGLKAAPGDFSLNILANLSLLGPGLILTNIIAARWKSRRREVAIDLALDAVCDRIRPLAKTCYKISTRSTSSGFGTIPHSSKQRPSGQP